MSLKERPLNVNTVLILILGGLITFGLARADKAITKIDETYNSVTELREQQKELSRRVSTLESSVFGIIIKQNK